MKKQRQINSALFMLAAVCCFACTEPQIQIQDLSNTPVANHAASELTNYLNAIYKGASFELTTQPGADADIAFLISSQANASGIKIQDLPTKPESFKITITGNKLVIIAPDERGLINGTYALLEKLGCGFYISGDALPAPKNWRGFDGWEMEDEPLKGDRFVFNWHNFLSGCTGWNLPDWQLWVDQANKMRYNGIMVHAYGNNPMFSFEFLGKRKATGYLNNTGSGRDWGNQHVNDVRRMVGGHIFNAPVYGAEASMAPEENKEKAATELMQQVFKYAEDRGMKVIFALDFDTWMANPRNIIEKLPKEAVFELGEGHLTPNPEHPAGYAYFEQVLRSLLEMYPETDQLSVWHRRPSLSPGLGTIWMNFPFEKFPDHWKKEYLNTLKQHPEITDDLPASSMFAYGKLIKALMKARDALKPGLEISSGSWQFDFVKYADVFFPEDVALLPLDWQVVFDQPEAKATLGRAGANRNVYPIIWAHHDDHRYIGRPYTPWENLATMLEERNSKGFGIIHWTTRPLDLYFSSSARQVWQSTANESAKTTVGKYVKDLFGTKDEPLIEYYYTWLTHGPLFGRETTDHFIDLGKQQLGHDLESWDEMKENTLLRLEQISSLTGIDNNSFLKYQKGMEVFYLSFFENQILFQQAFDHLAAGEISESIATMQQTDPEQAIEKYVAAIEQIGFTSGEKAIVFSMNTRWLMDYFNLEQRLGLRPVHFLFSPTRHDSLAQAPGHYSYFIDDADNWCRCLWRQEMKTSKFIDHDGTPVLLMDTPLDFALQTMHGQPLPDGPCRIDILVAGEVKIEDVVITQVQTGGEAVVKTSWSDHTISVVVDAKDGRSIKISNPLDLMISGIKLIMLQ